MSPVDLLRSLLSGTAPKNLRILAARGLTPFPPKETLELLVSLLGDKDQDVTSHAAQTLSQLEEEQVLAQLRAHNCASNVLAHFASSKSSDPVLQAVIAHPSSPAASIEALAQTVSAHLLEAILDNKVRILEFPGILENIKSNPFATPEIQRQIREIEIEFFGNKKKEYTVEGMSESPLAKNRAMELESDIPLEGLSLEGLPVDPEARQTAILDHLSKLSIGEKLRYALFGSREIRSVLIRDPNRQVARMVLRSPKLTENEVEAISAMRSVTDDILSEIGKNKEWTRNYNIVRNLVKNPKTPPLVSQRLIWRLQFRDLKLLTRDRNIPEAIRLQATRRMNQNAPIR